MLVLSSDPAITAIEPARRRCLFPQERRLELYSRYSFSNCILECYILQAAATARCVPWYFPRAATRQVTPDWSSGHDTRL